MIMAQTDAQKQASKRYLAKLDELKLRVPSGEGEIIKAHARKTGESTNAFLHRAVKETMERDCTREHIGNDSNSQQ